MRYSNTALSRNQARQGRLRPRCSIVARVLTTAISALLVLGACTSPDGVANPGTATPLAPSNAASGTPGTAPTSAPATEAAYQPATAAGPARNVPVPVLPEKAKEFSKEGLIAFTEYWYSTLGYAFETGDPEPMMAISGPDCKPCEAMKKTVVAGHSEGKWIVGGLMVINPPSATFQVMPDGTYQAITMARQDHVSYFKADKTLSKDHGVKTAQGDILVGTYENGEWRALTVEHLAGSKAS